MPLVFSDKRYFFIGSLAYTKADNQTTHIQPLHNNDIYIRWKIEKAHREKMTSNYVVTHTG
jgi:hypothetical protein